MEEIRFRHNGARGKANGRAAHMEGDAGAMRDVTDFHLQALIARKDPAISLLELVSTGIFILSFPVLLFGAIAWFAHWIAFNVMVGIYIAMTVGGVIGALGAHEIKRRLFVRRAVMAGTERADALAFWKNFDRGQMDVEN